jgi:hypothetical protein
MTQTITLPAHVLPTILGTLRARREMKAAVLERVQHEALQRQNGPVMDDDLRKIRAEIVDLDDAIAAVEVARSDGPAN